MNSSLSILSWYNSSLSIKLAILADSLINIYIIYIKVVDKEKFRLLCSSSKFDLFSSTSVKLDIKIAGVTTLSIVV